LPEENRLFATGWVHVFEEDTAEGAVYRPEDGDIPLSRRPRERITFAPDGKAVLFTQGPDDRYVGRPATWQEREGQLVVRARGGPVLTVVARLPDRLVVRVEERKKTRK
jgi:hypothetical protein